MDQIFTILAPRLHQTLKVQGPLEDILFDSSAQSLVPLLARPVQPPSFIPSQYTAVQSDTIRERDIFSRLPVELLQLVFNDLEIEDVLSLSLVSRYFWSVGEKLIQTYALSPLAPWAGEAIVCPGDYIEEEDYPPGMLTEKEENDLHESLKLFSFAATSSWNCGRVSRPLTLWRQLIESEEYLSMSASDRYQLEHVVYPDNSQLYPRDQPWILRNLTTKEYVRSEAIALKPGWIYGPFINFLGFGEVILLRTCWSTDSFINEVYEGDIARGPWAGHCFDIVTMGRHRQDGNCDEWKDVSEDVAREIASIWESQYGSNWREVIYERKVWRLR